MAVSDRAADSGLQARVWTVTLDGWLTSKRPDVNDYGWTLNACCVTSGVDAVGWTDGSTARQRVFFAREGAINFLDFDGDFFNAWGPLPAPAAGIEFGTTDVAALSWLESDVRRVAVASVSTDGRLCVWNGDEAGFTSSPICSSSGWASTSDTDVVGSVVGGVPIFAYRRATGALAVTRPFFTSWYGATLGMPSTDSGALRPSLAIYPSVASPGQAEVLVVGASGRLHAARFAPSSNAETWTALPLVPDGALPISQGNAVVALPYTTFDFFSGTLVSRVAVYVTSSSRRLYRAYSGSSGVWTGWASGSLGSAARPPSEQSWYGNGVGYVGGGSFLFGSPALFGVGGVNALFAAHFTTQEFNEAGFRDHLYHSHVDHDVALGSTTTGTRPANESTASLSNILGISTAIRRNSDGLPWQVVVSDTVNGGVDWSNDFLVRPAADWPNPGSLAALTDPYSAIESSGRFHHLSLEVPLAYPDPTQPTCMAVPGTRRLVYRTSSSASQIANTTAVGSSLRIVASSTGGLDHGGLALTRDAAGVTPHVVFIDGGVRHWFRTPAGAETTVALPELSGPPGVFAAADQELYAFTINGAMCRLNAGGVCAEVGTMGGASRMPLSSPTISFGPVDVTDPKARCSGRRCFDTPQAIGFAAHPTTARLLFAAYQGADPDGGTSIYFQKNDGASLGVWSAPIRIHARGFGDTTSFIDPSITVDNEGTLIVTYSRADTTAPSFTQYSAYSVDAGLSWTVTRLPVSWSPNDLPFHCSRGRFFVGEYREGSAVGNRAFNLLHRSSGGNTVLTNYWASRWSVNGY